MMYKSPSDGFTLEELRSEFDWMFEFQSRMAEHIRNDPDVHSLADYVGKIEAENAKLRELVVRMFHTIEWSDRMSDSMYWPSFSYERELRELGVEVDE